MKVERFFHIRPSIGVVGRGGATVRVVGDTEMVGQVDVQVAFCSPKDMFCKRVGRQLATNAPLKVVSLRYLPHELKRVADKVTRTCKVYTNDNYMFSLRYFLPKE